MKKLIIFSTTLFYSFLFSQKKEEPAKSENKNPNDSYYKIDTADSFELKAKKNRTTFYKNVDSTKASKYKMLSKKPENQYSELQQRRPETKLYHVEKLPDSIKIKKKK